MTPVGIGALAAGQAGDLPEQLAGVVIGLHVLVPVVHQQIGVAGLNGGRHLRAGHAGFLRAAGIEAAAGDCRRRGLSRLFTEGERPGGLFIENLGAFLAAADGGIQLLHAALLLRLA